MKDYSCGLNYIPNIGAGVSALLKIMDKELYLSKVIFIN